MSSCTCRVLLPFVLLCALSGMAQTTFVVRIVELRSSKYTCTVMGQDGRLRREVTSIAVGQTGRPEVFEGAVSEHDVERLKSLIADPDFQTASQQNRSGITVVPPDGRILIVEANLGNKEPQRVAFGDPNGKATTPPYLVGFLSFADEVKDRKLPKLKGKIEPMCKAPSHH
jgi:hypothetical protein